MKHVLGCLLSLTAAVGLPLASINAHSEENSPRVNTAEKNAIVLKEQDTGMVNGEVVKVDNDRLKIVIKHHELTGLGMPAMTMVFSVSDRLLLKGIKVGQNIKFVAQLAPHGLLVTEIGVENN